MYRILLDCDGVLSDFVGSALEVINALSGVYPGFQPHHVVDWHIEKLLPKHLQDAFFWHMEQPNFCLNMKTLRGEIHLARELQRLGHEIIVVTSPWKSSDHWIKEREMWLRSYLGDIEICHTDKKYLIQGDIFVDDKPEHVEKWKQSNPMNAGYLFDAPYNKDVKLPRIKSLRELC